MGFRVKGVLQVGLGVWVALFKISGLRASGLKILV